MENISYSMYIDEKRKIYKWVNDDAVKQCHKCKSEFNMINRKHHCRICGRIYCYICANNWANINKDLIIKCELNKIEKTTKNYLKKYVGVRLCNDCYKNIDEEKYFKDIIKIFELLELNIIELKIIGLVCKEWNKASKYLLKKIRDLYYTFGNYNYNEQERKLLWINRKIFIGHNLWLIRLLKSINIEDYLISYNKIKEILELISNKNKKIECKELKCSRFCSEKLNIEDCIYLIDKNIKINILKKYIIENLEKYSIEDLTIYLIYIINYIKYENIEDSIIGNYLINKCINLSKINDDKIKKNILNFLNEYYWLIKINDNIEIYKYYLNLFEIRINPLILNLIKDGEKTINFIKNKKYNIESIRLPTNLSFHDLKLNKNEIKIKDSGTKPIYFPFYNSNIQYNILLKNEDLRKDKIIINLIKLCDNILKKELFDLNIITYNIIPINKNQGIIEIVNDSETLYNIQEKKFSLLNYIIENNNKERIDIIKKNFMTSCAAYSVITYLLGIGDRHLDNIMINNKGIMFHIDYSYILGNDAKPITPYIRITDEMINVMGGINSKTYKEFCELCNKIYNILRRHINLFITFLNILPEIDESFNLKEIEKVIIERFIPGESTKEAELQLSNYIDNSSKDYKHYISDIAHYYNKKYISQFFSYS